MQYNVETATTYVFVFEAPTAEWSEAWTRYGKTMTNRYVINRSL